MPRLAGIVKRGVGANTRIGAARFISGLALRMGPDIRPSSGALIKVPRLARIALEAGCGVSQRFEA